jgi:hypothetical protein
LQTVVPEGVPTHAKRCAALTETVNQAITALAIVYLANTPR